MTRQTPYEPLPAVHPYGLASWRALTHASSCFESYVSDIKRAQPGEIEKNH